MVLVSNLNEEVGVAVFFHCIFIYFYLKCTTVFLLGNNERVFLSAILFFDLCA